MVEFGLKLQDNKVQEWADRYIDYEKLKGLIKRASNASKVLSDLENRRPELAAEIRAAYNAGEAVASNVATPRILSEQSLGKSGERQNNESFEENLEALDKPGEERVTSVTGLESPPANEKESLLGKIANTATYCSHNSSVSESGLCRRSSENSLAGLLAKGVSGVTGYFQKGAYTTKFKDALREEASSFQSFEQCILEELDKVNSFYTQKVSDVNTQLEVLVESVGPKYKEAIKPQGKVSGWDKVRRKLMLFKRASSLSDTHLMLGEESDDETGVGNSHSDRAKRASDIRESNSIQRALIDLYRTSKLLNNYSMMNFTGFIKIVKKFDKSFPKRKGQFEGIVDDNTDRKEAEMLAEKMEGIFANWFCGRNTAEARAKMLPKRGDELQMDWSQLRLGYRLGMCSILALWVCWDCVWGLVADGSSTIGGRTAFPVFRACGGLLLVHWFWGFSVYIWTRYRINYIFLFDFDPRIVDSPVMIFTDATDSTLVFLILMLLYYKSGANDIPNLIPPGGYPFILVLFTVKNLIFPWRTRRHLWRAIFAVVAAPFTSPVFFHTYIADVFTSMVKVFQDIVWTVCFIGSRDFLIAEDSDELPNQWQKKFWYKNVLIPLVCLFPLWIRFNQCLRQYMNTRNRWPHLANAFKYAMSQTVTLFGAFHPLYLLHSHSAHTADLHTVNDATIEIQNQRSIDVFQIFWMSLFIASSLYSFFWDVYMDWGLGRPAFGFLGFRLMFPRKLHYYGVITADLFLRFMWVLTLVPPQSGAKFEIPNYLTAATMSLELLRRTLWGFFRLEHEHRHNTSGFRRVDFVPLHFNTGHNHKYKQQKEHVGWQVLGEVSAVSLVVIIVSVASIIAAERATRYSEGMQHMDELL